MSKIRFKDKNFRPASLELIGVCNAVIAQYMEQDLTLTLRQLYYQLVVRNVITNAERSYQNLSRLVSDGRLAGKIDWNAIEDRIRQPRMSAEFADPKQLMEAAVSSYRLPRWQDQPEHVELWVEKDALAGVLEPITRKRHITLMVNRGYSSQSAMFDTRLRLREAAEEGKQCTILYLGDLDPSGEDMVRDIDDRLNVMFQTNVRVIKLGITMEQVGQFKPPPNPAKMSDSRAPAYVEKFGYESYEVDALPPEELDRIVNDAVDELEDRDKMDAVKEREEEDRSLIEDAAADIMEARY